MPNPKKTDNNKDVQDTRPPSDPPPWFHAEMEKGFLRIQELIDRRLEKMSSEIQSINLRMVEVETKQTEIEEAVTGFHKDVADVKLAVDDEFKQLKDRRHQNLHLVGFPEGVEGKKIGGFFEGMAT